LNILSNERRSLSTKTDTGRGGTKEMGGDTLSGKRKNGLLFCTQKNLTRNGVIKDE